jgi:predicted Zn-dependent protease
MLLAAGVDPAGMIAFLESLEKAEGQSPETLTYLSSHPSPGERVRKLRTLTARAPRTPITLLDDAGWLALRRMCEGMAPPR